MKTSAVPIVCGFALVVMSSAGVSHWWSVRQFSAAVASGHLLVPKEETVTPLPESPPQDHRPLPFSQPDLLAMSPKAAAAPDATQAKFFESLISKIENLQNQNRDMLDQIAETNREVMITNFRVDTHSESFRPMPVNEDAFETSFDDGPGVLPPRAEPVELPFGE